MALVRFGPDGAKVDHQFQMGMNPTELVGPHGVGVSPDGRYYYVSTAHGMPHGALWKYTTTGDSLRGRVTLGSLSGDGAGIAERGLRVRRKFQLARRHGAVVGERRVRSRDGGDRARANVHDAARVALQPAGQRSTIRRA